MNSVKLILNFFDDLLIRILPISKKNKELYAFAFLVHSRDINDIYRKFKFLKYFPKFLVEAFTYYSWPITVSKVTGLKSNITNNQIPGWIIGIPMTARQMVENRSKALNSIVKASKLAEKKGAKIIGLGALTSSLSKGGLDLIDKVNINITTGHAYTAYNVTANLFNLTNFIGIEKSKVTVAIVGAAGSVGSTSAKLIARNGFIKLILIDVERKKHFFDELINDIKKLNSNAIIEISHQIKSIKNADFIITATNAPEALVKSEDLKSGAIIIDDAQPSDVSKEVFEREDVLIVEAGVVHTPDIKSNFNMGLKSRNDNFCCMAEVLILAAQEWKEHYVINRANLDLVDEISSLGSKMNFKLAEYQNFNEKISDFKINKIKEIIRKNHGYY